MQNRLCFIVLLLLFLARSKALPISSQGLRSDSYFTERVEDDPELIAGFFEGDMDITSTFNGVSDTSKRWPNGVVHYKIGTMFDVNHELFILWAMEIIESKSCIRFLPALENATAFINIVNASKGCHSKVGYNGLIQTLNLQVDAIGIGCFKIGTILHELLHALGFYHQHSVSERDEYIKVVPENILDGKERSFQKLDNGMTNNFGVAYDYDSIMHYSAKAYSKNGKDTIIPLKGGSTEMGQRLDLSKGDVKKLNLMYNCK